MSILLIAIFIYLGLAVLSFIPIYLGLIKKEKLFVGGAEPEQSPILSDEAKTRSRVPILT